MEYVAIASAVMGAFGQVEAGSQRRQQYRLQAEQSRLQAEQKALEYTRQGNAVLDRINNANAAAAARAYAGGTMGFEGSSALVQAATERRGGRELLLTQEGAASARRRRARGRRRAARIGRSNPDCAATQRRRRPTAARATGAHPASTRRGDWGRPVTCSADAAGCRGPRSGGFGEVWWYDVV